MKMNALTRRYTRTAIPLRYITAGELGRYVSGDLKTVCSLCDNIT